MNNQVILSAITIFLMSCSQIKNHEGRNDKQIVEPDSLCLKKKKLTEAVLNYPDFVRYSKLLTVKKSFDAIFITFEDSIDCVFSSYVQQEVLELIEKKDSINTIGIPVYEIKALSVSGDSAYVHMEFDITGAIAYGSLLQSNGKWIPDSTFVIGVR